MSAKPRQGEVAAFVPAVLIVMGISGYGKSTVGALLAQRLHWEFEDADWFHQASNVDKMHSGIPLSDELHRLFRQFSWPYGIPSHVAPETPGSIHAGGELGYSLVHSYGRRLRQPRSDRRLQRRRRRIGNRPTGHQLAFQ